jgi:heterodisulfide reductase subunit C
MAIVLNELDAKFKYEVAEEPGGENIKNCFACGLCTAGCPIAEIDENYNPRKLIRQILLGMRKEVLSSDLIWICSLCYTCYAHCPQNVKFTDITRALRAMAVREGYVHPSFPEKIKAIDQASQKIRHKTIMSIVKNKKEEIKIEPEKLLAEASQNISALQK